MKNQSESSKALAQTLTAELVDIKKQAECIELSVDADEDYNHSRDLLKRLLSQAEASLVSLVALARESEHPRAFEVLAGLLKTTGDLANQLVGLQKKRHELDRMNNPTRDPDAPKHTGDINNTIYVGSTTDLQRLIKANVNEKIIEVDEIDYELDND